MSIYIHFLMHNLKELLRLFAVVPINGRMAGNDTDLAGRFLLDNHSLSIVAKQQLTS